MRGQEEGQEHRGPQEPRPQVERLGPPGWTEFAAARRRFESGLAIQGLERAWVGPAHVGTRTPPGRP